MLFSNYNKGFYLNILEADLAKCAIRLQVVLIWGTMLTASVPVFDLGSLFQRVLIPTDAPIGSIIYRLRASDPNYDYPLLFNIDGTSTAVSINTLECSRLNSICQANVILERKLEAGRLYDFKVNVLNRRGEAVSLNCSFLATNATTPINEIFPGAPTLLTISEKSKRHTELGTIRARGNPSKSTGVLLELWGSPEFGLHQKFINERDAEATIVLLSPLDYETKTVHHVSILANDPWTEESTDTRNIASWPILIAVLDEQDTPPVFTLAPPTTTLSPSLEPGDSVLRVHAEDGDRGNPRSIIYSILDSEKNSITSFFNISEETGEVRLTRPLEEVLSINDPGKPILLTIIAEEVKKSNDEPLGQSSTVQIALIPPRPVTNAPTFASNEYSTLLEENSPIGTPLNLLQAEIITQPGDVLTLDLMNNNGTFDISPKVVKSQSSFSIKVQDPSLLDYELWHSVQCYIVAKRISSDNATAVTAKLTVLLIDVNDNPPIFTKKEYQVSIQENTRPGTPLLTVEAEDIDRAPGNRIHYPRLLGPDSVYFTLDRSTGTITVARDLDAETSSTLTFNVEAVDDNGKGGSSTATIIVNVIDVNDEAPQFEKNVYEYILNQKRNTFTTEAFIKAIDKDVSAPNNEVHYELINPVDNLFLDSTTGQLSIRGEWKPEDIVAVRARAWDSGMPRLSTECEIRIYPPEANSRKVVFIVPGKNVEKESVRQTLSALTGSRVVVDEIRPYTGYEPDATYIGNDNSKERSVVVATISYSKDSVIDVNKIQQILDNNQKSVNTKEETKTKSGGSLLWLLILLILLALIALAILILCCICQGCPLYAPPKKRHIAPQVEKVVRHSGVLRESKSVQVAEWFGKRKAWTPEHVSLDNESLRRHEFERGSDRTETKHILQRQQHLPEEQLRDQLYIRDGNTDILRLITRGNETRRPVTHMAEQEYLVDSGKHILMKRFIDQQTEASKSNQAYLPKTIHKLQEEHDFLENTLRQQNFLLRQILLERERDLRLETQSLPAGTQTDHNVETQTELSYFLPPRRKVRSDNDDNEESDDELLANRIRMRDRSRFSHQMAKAQMRRKIKTPIQEESEIELLEKAQKQNRENKPRWQIKQTKTSELRQKNLATKSKPRNSQSAIQREVLREISASLYHSDDSSTNGAPTTTRKRKKVEKYYSDDEENTNEKSVDLYKQKYYSESDIRMQSPQRLKKQSKNSQRKVNKSQATPSRLNKSSRGVSRYMEWYKKGAQKTSSARSSVINEKPLKRKNETIPMEVEENAATTNSTTSMSSQQTTRELTGQEKKVIAAPEHPLLQHSEHRFEAQYPISRRYEEDVDSGIVLTKPSMAVKKSVFTIAYDDMQTKQLHPDIVSPPLTQN